MKQIKTIISAVISGALLFSACTKSEQYNVAPSQAAAASNTPGKTPIQAPNNDFTKIEATTGTSASEVAGINNVMYQLTPILSTPNSLMKWSSGYFSIGAISFDAIHVAGNALFKVSYGTGVQRVAQIQNTTVLGGFNVPGGLYNTISVNMTLTPMGQQNIMFLTGVYNAGQVLFPIQLMVNESIQLSASAPNQLQIGSNSATKATIYLNMDQLFNGIDQTMLENATKTNGTIILSLTDNQNLYQMVLANLRNSLTVQFGQ